MTIIDLTGHRQIGKKGKAGLATHNHIFVEAWDYENDEPIMPQEPAFRYRDLASLEHDNFWEDELSEPEEWYAIEYDRDSTLYDQYMTILDKEKSYVVQLKAFWGDSPPQDVVHIPAEMFDVLQRYLDTQSAG